MIDRLLKNPFDLDAYKVLHDFLYDTLSDSTDPRDRHYITYLGLLKYIIDNKKFPLSVYLICDQDNTAMNPPESLPSHIYATLGVAEGHTLYIKGLLDGTPKESLTASLLYYNGPLFVKEWEDAPGRPNDAESYNYCGKRSEVTPPLKPVNNFQLNCFQLNFFREMPSGDQYTYATTERQDIDVTHIPKDPKHLTYPQGNYYGVYCRYNPDYYFLTFDVDSPDKPKMAPYVSSTVMGTNETNVDSILKNLKDVGYLLYQSSGAEGPSRGSWIITDIMIPKHQIYRSIYCKSPIAKWGDVVYQSVAKSKESYVLRAFPREGFVPKELRFTSKSPYLKQFREEFNKYWRRFAPIKSSISRVFRCLSY